MEQKERIGTFPVVDKGKLVGIVKLPAPRARLAGHLPVTESDLVRLVTNI